MRLSDGTLRPKPVTLNGSEKFSDTGSIGDSIALRDVEGMMVAVVKITDIWKPDKKKEAETVFGTTNAEHPAFAYLMKTAGDAYIGGEIERIRLPEHYDFS